MTKHTAPESHILYYNIVTTYGKHETFWRACWVAKEALEKYKEQRLIQWESLDRKSKLHHIITDVIVQTTLDTYGGTIWAYTGKGENLGYETVKLPKGAI